MGIKHSDVKASGEKGFAAEWNKNHIVDGDIDMGQHQLTDNVIENRTDFPAGPVEGQIIYRTDLNKLYIYDGAAWDEIWKRLNKTSYWFCHGANFTAEEPDVDDVTITKNGFQMNADNVDVFAPVFLPHGAIITGAVVYGNFVNHNWTLRRTNSAGTTTDLATAAVGTEDNTIATPTVDNSTYSYAIEVDQITGGQVIYGAKITYTTDYD